MDRRDAGVLVEVADSGRGFVPDEVSPHKRGVSLSIVERMTAAGGTASVSSRPGAGTRVRLAWSPTIERGDSAASVVDRLRQARSAAVTVYGFLRGIRLSIFAIVAALLLTWELPMLAGHTEVYGSLAVQIVAYGVLLIVAIAAGVRVLRDRPMGRWGLPLMAVVVGAAVAAGFGVPPEATGTSVHRSYGNVGWFGLLLLMDSPLWILLAVPVVDYVLALARFVAGGQVEYGSVALLTTASVFIWLAQFAVAVSTWTLRRVAEVAAGTALEALMAAATTARVTVVASPTAATVSVVADLPAEAAEPAISNHCDQVTVNVMTTGRRLWVEAVWREQSRSR